MKIRTFSYKVGHTLMFGDEEVITFKDSNFRYHVLAEAQPSSHGMPWVYNVNSECCEPIPNPYHLKLGESLRFKDGTSVLISRMSKEDFRVCVRTKDDRTLRQKKKNFIVSTIMDDNNVKRPHK